MFLFIFWDRGRQSMSRGGAERGEGHRIWSGFQALSCQHRAWCGAQSHKPQDHNLSGSWTLNWLSHPGASSIIIILLEFILFWEWKSTSGGGAERGRERIPSRLCVLSAEPDAGLELTSHEIMTWAEVRCLTDWATQVPQLLLCLKEKLWIPERIAYWS